VHARRTPPRVDAHGRLEAQQVVELLACPLGLAGLLELGDHVLAQLEEHLDVERGVLEPRLGQRARRPVGGGVLLAHPLPQHGLDQGGETDAGVAEEASGELGVEEAGRGQADLAQARQVLGGGVEDPLGAGEGVLQRCEGGHPDGVDQPGACSFAAQLDQVGAVGVAVARGALGVDGDRSGRLGQGRTCLQEPGVGVDDLREAVAQLEQGGGCDLGLGCGLGGLGGVGLSAGIGLCAGGVRGVGHRFRCRAVHAGSGWR
jgi:hypothetical protein